MSQPKYLEYLQVYNCEKKMRLGSNNDGGYIIADLSGGYDCYISAGVSDEESFSRDFINLYKTDYKNSFAFDGTISRYPTQYTRNISFIRKNIAPYSSRKTRNLSVLIDSFDTIFLKMDIEGAEYEVLNLTIEPIPPPSQGRHEEQTGGVYRSRHRSSCRGFRCTLKILQIQYS